MIDEDLLNNLRSITKMGVSKHISEGMDELAALRKCVLAFVEATNKGYLFQYKWCMVEIVKQDFPHLLEEMEKLFLLF